MKTLRSKTPTVLATGIAAALLATGALAADPYAKPDESWISISGTVVAPGADEFTLDYGKGVIKVEMDDWDRYGEAYGLMDGDSVTVYGRIDDDLYELASIEASAVYVDSLNTYFYASSADEEGVAEAPISAWTIYTVPVPSQATVSGTVTSVNKEAREFTIDTGASMLTVDTSTMPYNPLDELGYQKIAKGDHISVTGDIDYEFFDGRVLEATAVTTLLKDRS